MLAIVLAMAIQQPQEIVRRGVEAAGGESALRALRSAAVEYYAANFGIGQSETAESPLRASIATGRMTMDWHGNRRFVEQETRVGAGPVNRLRRVTAGGIGFAETGTQQTTRSVDGPAVVAAVETQMRRDPIRLLLAALDNPAAVSATGARLQHPIRGETTDAVRFALGADTANLFFDSHSGELRVIQTVADDPVLGDRYTETWLTRWHPAGAGLTYPRQTDTYANGQLVSHQVNTSVTLNGALDEGLFAIPDSLAALAGRGPAPPPVVTVTLAQLAPGVWRADGGSHHTLVVEQGQELLLAEAPQSAARMNAVLDTLRSRFPGHRVSRVINTHHHWDHSGGLRAAMAAGLPVVTHFRNDGFVRRVASARKTIAPDELSRRRRIPEIRLVRDSMTIGSGDSRVMVYALPTIHSADMLAVWVPSAGVLFTSDVLNPGATLAPAGSRELVAFAQSRGLAPQRYAGGHGAVQDWAAVVRAAN